MTEPVVEAGSKVKTRREKLGSIEVDINEMPEHIIVAISLRLRRIERDGDGANVADLIDVLSSVMEASCSRQDQDKILMEVEAGRVEVLELLRTLMPSGDNRAERRAVEASRNAAPAPRGGGRGRRRSRR